MTGREGEGFVTDQRLVRIHGILGVSSGVREGNRYRSGFMESLGFSVK